MKTKGKAEEIKFWKKFLEQNFETLTQDEISNHRYITGNKEPYQQFKEFLIKAANTLQKPIEKLSVLDVGSGAVNVLGNMIGKDKFNMTQTDVLAHDYQELLKPYRIMCQMLRDNMCKMRFEDNSFDIVHCSNALDHCENPIRAIEEMKRVARHCVFLRHFQNVGKIEQYKGMHQWDISENNGVLEITSKEGLVATYPEFVTTCETNDKGVKFIYATYRK